MDIHSSVTGVTHNIIKSVYLYKDYIAIPKFTCIVVFVIYNTQGVPKHSTSSISLKCTLLLAY